ncbi:TonB-dependent receptor [Parapedobacter sp. SGR-10]|uniref:TonB-dependent receptor n=1 Tax=Parapedobacter sp. SGR-10 TaxID=2710879 RepID=UPI0013D71B16|nr:TonB-dependent receptor [Parapedobacter sp. SGR-10]NGF55189.1 TonB-dependent receptor [Parapedobacter sp. SGR-10]
MKNYVLSIGTGKLFPRYGYLLIMKMIVLFLLVAVSQLQAGVLAQTVSLTKKSVPIVDIFREIRKQTNYTVICNAAIIKETPAIDIDIKNVSLERALKTILEPNELTYTIKGKAIVIKKKTPNAYKAPPKRDRPNTVQENLVTGLVTNASKQPLQGVTVTVKGKSHLKTGTDLNGRFVLNVGKGETIVISLVGHITQEVLIGDQQEITISMEEDLEGLEEVVVVGFGTQKKESVISAITSVSPKDLRVPSSNLTTALAGRIAGMISYQTSGEPGRDNADFFIRGVTTFGAGKVDPLILIDNVEVTPTDLSKMHPDDIQNFSILKDATATSLYGARGANGVILITTKEGKEGKVRVSVRMENSFSEPTSTIKMADPITYMRLANEAASTRNPLASTPYSNNKIDATMNADRNQFVYPAVDWMDMITKDVAMNQRANLNISGGGTVARYYIAGSFAKDNGILKVDERNNFNSNVDYEQYMLRSNININLTSSTEAIVRLHGTFDDYNGPIAGGSDMYRKVLQVSPVRFPAYFEPDEFFRRAGHILFGGFEGDSYMNPYAELLRGYRQESRSKMMAQMELKQDLGALVPGLTGRLLGNTTRISGFDLTRSYSPFYYQILPGQYNRFTDEYRLTELNPTGGSEFITYAPGYKAVESSFYGEASLAYNRTFNAKHEVSGMLVGIARNALTANAATLSASLPQRNLGLSGRLTYGYDNRYFAEFNFGYNGSEKFDKGHRWGFFPSVGIGWSVDRESFWKGELKEIVSKLKLRGTYGLVGNDEIGSQRFFYLSEVTIGGGGNFTTGYNFNGINHNGVLIRNYANPNIGWEIARKTNVGLELGLFNGKVDIIADLFHEYRSNILQSRADIPVEMGLWSTPQVNVGEAQGRGIDASLDYKHNLSSTAWLIGRANFTYARSTYLYYEEAEYSRLNMDWLSKRGNAVKQQWGYVAERLFIDDADVANSPRQEFGEYMAGDIKYKDINGDNIINELDRVPIGYPTIPEINYGFGLSAGYKNLDVSIFFQGSARSSFWIDAATMSPFRQHSSDGKILETGLAQFIADDHWTELSQNPNAAWPRLSNILIDNNNQRSTWFLRNNAFLRFKSAEIGYELPKKWIDRVNLSSCRFYLSGTNLLVFSKFKLWDVEMGGNGLGYPLQRVFNLGVNLSF